MKERLGDKALLLFVMGFLSIHQMNLQDYLKVAIFSNLGQFQGFRRHDALRMLLSFVSCST